jgi:putative transposase
MPWRDCGVEELRRAFVVEHGREALSMAALCAAYGVSRKTGYKWLSRFRQDGFAGLSDRSHAPHEHGRATEPELIEALVGLKLERPSWGPRKLVARLAHLHPQVRWPSHSTAASLLRQAGLVTGRRGRRGRPTPGLLTRGDRPNRVWAADHKGWFRLGDGTRCEPLTITDGASRFLIGLQATSDVSFGQARPVFERAFDQHGLPDVIRTDNGPPFASSGVTGLTALSAWWIRLGIRPERIAPGRPQQNGQHERFHATLAEAIRPASATAADQQARFDAFRAIYNGERPHEALGQTTPASAYSPSIRRLPAREPEPDYPPCAAVRRVRQSGEIKWNGRLLHVSQAIAGQHVAIEETATGEMKVRYYEATLGVIDHRTRKLIPCPQMCHPSIRADL